MSDQEVAVDAGAGAQVMPCMEVWGGNQAVDCGVIMSGLDAWLYSRPYRGDAGGGDVHYVSSCATGRVTRLLLADVSGHGAAVADTGEKLRHLMRRYVNHLDQGRFVVALNRQFTALTGEGRFATSIVGTFFAPTNRLTLTNAGHPPPLLYRARHRAWCILQERGPGGGGPARPAAGVPLGILEASEYEQHDVQLRVGDLVLSYTDSLIESKDAGGKLLGTVGLLAIVADLDAGQPQHLIPALLSAIAARHDGNLSGDDVTVLLIRPNGLAPRVPLGRRLKAPLVVAGGLLRSLRPGGGPMPWPQINVPNIGGAIFSPLNRLWRAREAEGE